MRGIKAVKFHGTGITKVISVPTAIIISKMVESRKKCRRIMADKILNRNPIY